MVNILGLHPREDSSILSRGTKEGVSMIKFFINRESILSHKYRLSGISIDYRKYLNLNLNHQEQIIFESRLMEMTPAQYLRYLRDEKGAKLYIVADTYITYYFENSRQLDAHLTELNKRILKFLTKAK